MELLSGKTLFQLHAERIVKLQQLVEEGDGGTIEGFTQLTSPAKVKIPWYIMLSDSVHAKTVDFFTSHKYFGLDPEQIVFFDQSDFPCLTPEGKIIMESSSKVESLETRN